MRKITPTLLTTAFVCSLLATPVPAQTRVFVAAQGSDTNPCTFALPCRTFQHAHATVLANGEIDVLDPAGYGALTISKSISIQGHGFSGITATSGNAIVINAGATDKINLSGLVIDGFNSGSTGILFNTGKTLVIDNTVVRNFTQFAIDYTPSGDSSLAVSDTRIGDNNFGVFVHPTGAASARCVFARVQIYNNFIHGIDVEGVFTTGSLDTTISDSVAHANGHGFVASNAGGTGTNRLMVLRSEMANNDFGLVSSAATVRISRSTITGNGTALSGTGQIISYGDNNIDGNTNDGAPTSTIMLK